MIAQAATKEPRSLSNGHLPTQEKTPPALQAKTRPLLLLSHTHWDREWYLTFEAYRVRLVEILDAVLAGQEANREFRHFHADAQTVIFKDYLEVRPGQKKALQAALAEGRICAGPFYVLNDEFLCSGEAWVENLLFGAEDCARMGATPSRTCYVVDNFGHISQLPQISAQFGLRYFYGIRGWPFGEIQKSEFWVEGPDGSRLLALCHPWTYGLMRAPGESDESIRGKLDDAVEKLESLAAPNAPLLLMNGIDHASPPRNLNQILRVIRHRDPQARQVSLDEYFEQLESVLPDEVETKRLESRFVPGLYDVLSSRMPQKLLYEEARVWLEDRLDPLFALRLIHGFSISNDHRKYFWRRFLENLPHDSICGCSIDAVHRDIQRRLEGCIEGVTTLFLRAFDDLAGGSEKPNEGEEASHLHFFNSLPQMSEGVVEAELDFPEEEGVFHWQVEDEDGTEIPFQLLGTERIIKRLPSEDDVPVRKPMLRARIALQTSIPPLGIRRLTVRPRGGRHNLFSAIYGTENHTATFSFDKAQAISQTHGLMENVHLRCELDPHGTWTILHKASGQTLHRQNMFEHAPDLGDLYKRGQLPANPRTLSDGALRRVTLERNGPFLATYAVEFALRVPVGVEKDYSGMKAEEAEILICSRATLRKDSPILEFATTIDNTASDHEIRALFPAHAAELQSAADGIFDVIERPRPTESQVLRHPYLQAFQSSRAPNKEFIDLSDESFGLAVLSSGLQEHEILPGHRDAIALTLLRATGWIYRESMGETSTPEAQCHGKMTARYALFPHEGDWRQAAVKPLARRFCAGVFSRHLYATGQAKLRMAGGLLSLSGPAAFSTLKPSHDGHGIIVRLYNPTGAETMSTLQLQSKENIRIHHTAMNESAGERLPLHDGVAKLRLNPYEIASLRLQKAGGTNGDSPVIQHDPGDTGDFSA